MEECIRLYIKEIPDPSRIDPEIVRCFPSERRDFILRAAEKPAAESYAAGLLLRDVLNVTGDSDLRITENGKPYLADGSRFFSLSHSPSVAVLAVSPVEIGVDTEPVRPLTDSLIRKVFTEDEKRFIEKDPLKNPVVLWTRLEAMLKLSGEGIPGIDNRTAPLLSSGNGLYYHSIEYGDSFITTACGTALPLLPGYPDPSGNGRPWKEMHIWDGNYPRNA